MEQAGDFIRQQGQAFESFRLLIAVILGLAVLLIILGVIDYFNNEKFKISVQRFYNGFDTAMQTPNGRIVELDDLYFQPGIITAYYFSKRFHLPESCIRLDARTSKDIVLDSAGTRIEIKKVVQTNAFFRCDIGTGGCQMSCIASLGKKIA